MIYLRDPFSRKEGEKTIDSSSLPIIDRVRLPCFHATFFFSPLQQHPRVPQKRKYMEASSTSAVLMVESADMAQLLMDGHRIEDFQHNLFHKNHPHNTRNSRRMQGYGVKCQFPFAFSSKPLKGHKQARHECANNASHICIGNTCVFF